MRHTIYAKHLYIRMGYTLGPVRNINWPIWDETVACKGPNEICFFLDKHLKSYPTVLLV